MAKKLCPNTIVINISLFSIIIPLETLLEILAVMFGSIFRSVTAICSSSHSCEP